MKNTFRAWLAVGRTLLRAWARALARGGRVHTIIRAGGLGDVLWAAAAAKEFAALHPADEVIFATTPAMREVVGLAWPEAPVLASELFHGRLVGVLRRLSHAHLLEYEKPGAPPRHIVQDFLEGLRIRTPPPAPRWHFRAHPAERTAYLYAGPSWAVRELPAATWAEVAAALRSELQLRVVQVLPEGGAPPRIPACDDYLVGEPLAALCGRFDSCAVLITIDAVMMHLAQGTNAPLVALFGPTRAACRFIHGRPRQVALEAGVPCIGCHHLHPPGHWQEGCLNGIACMKSFTAATIVSAVRQVLAA